MPDYQLISPVNNTYKSMLFAQLIDAVYGVKFIRKLKTCCRALYDGNLLLKNIKSSELVIGFFRLVLDSINQQKRF